MRLQQEMDRKKKEDDLRRQAERRGPSRHGSRGPSRSGRDLEPAPAPAPASYGRSDSPPIPTLRSQPGAGAGAGAGDSSAQAVADSGGSSEVVDQLQAQLSTEFRKISTILREGPCWLIGVKELSTHKSKLYENFAKFGCQLYLQNMRQNLQRRRESLQYEEEKLGDTWSGLAEL